MKLAPVDCTTSPSLFSAAEIELFERSIQSIPLKPSVVLRRGVSTLDNTFRSSQQLSVPQRNPFVYKLMMNVVRTNEQHFKYQIDRYLNQIDFVVYEPGCFFDWHTDPLPNRTDRKITTIVFLSDSSNYQGGRLYFKDPDRGTFRVDQEIGTVVHFNSTAMHTAMKVESGLRKVVVAWSG